MIEEQKFTACFDKTLVPIKFIQPGVFRCNAPAFSEPGFVTLKIYYEGRPLATA